jgi:transcriptional regulator with XRE-family HTH domain
MLTATLGGLIKDYRIKKRLSQMEISLRIGWKDTTRLSKIEQGRVGKPTRQTIEKIIKALDLNEQETGEFLFMGGYLPTDEEISAMVKEFKSKIDGWPYPAYLMDFSWRAFYMNAFNMKVFNLSLIEKNTIEKERVNILEFPFFPRNSLSVDVEKGEDEASLKPFIIAQIAAFKTETFHYQNESWYKKTIQYLMKYEKFRELWPIIELKDYHKKLFDSEYKRITGIYNGKKWVLNFHMFTAKVITDPRFQITFYTPADDATFKFYKNLAIDL